ncbi:hypothetical protein FM038_017250 [Shewanella eurypsychrophilus]|uniref:Uncharacterized protein n=1 Tax=Shewanella eurypsychrophilus TaxID=2593656 RepID=A0ABX6VAC1_9GAMM|nr:MULTISPECIES: hypothetical protein [Shewanella]QFU23744.1 hypothetical protein FS418_19030 [Shewanella sp. YLB-09]QPG58967.1 hypothetical protein FM038_017250 [Shewanella eurypsychrophilus]
MKVKPLNASQKKLLRHLALALATADLEAKVLKPRCEAEGKPFKDGDFSKIYFKKMPEVAQAERAFKKAVEEAWGDLKYSFEADREEK